ncbi:hypothetical protein N9B82_01665 [Saprospiraceae bacterium]|nr:hypothetical protein [Saprospiraceae bacterium]
MRNKGIAMRLFAVILILSSSLSAQDVSTNMVGINFLSSAINSSDSPKTPHDNVEDKSFSLLLKTSPLDYTIGRGIIALEYRLSARGSLELTGLYDDIENIQVLHHDANFGRVVHFNLRYKHYFTRRSSNFVTGKGIIGGGFFGALGTSYSRTPRTLNPATTLDRYWPSFENERSTVVGLTADLGFSHKIASRFNLEYFIGAEVGTSSNSIMYSQLDEPILGRGAWRVGRLGIRLGYYLF